MKQQNTTFQIPAGILSAVRRFNDSVEGTVKEISKISHVTLTDKTEMITFYGRTGEKMVAPAKSLEDVTKQMREVSVPALEQNIAKLREDLVRKKVPLD